MCTAIDVRTDELSACTSDTDCKLRWGSGCCEDCAAAGPEELTAVGNKVDFASAICGNELPPCCAPAPYPPNAEAVCKANHCAVQL